MQLQRLKRLTGLPARFRKNLLAIRTLRNWGEFLTADLGISQLQMIRARNGVVLHRSDDTNLKFLFDEIWLYRAYTPSGYELKAGSVVIDIGANIGVFATYAASRAPGIKVLAYEPFPRSASVLRRNVAGSALPHVRIFEKAVAGSSGDRVLDTKSGNSVMNALRPPGTVSAPESAGVSVACVRLDEVFEENGIAWCDFLKIDCEGSEYEILRNCSSETWSRIGRLVVEYHEGPGVDGTREELIDLLTAHSFIVEHVESIDHRTGYLCARSRSFDPTS